MRYALLVAYDGTNFCGWQVQPNCRTVQAELETALALALGARVSLTGSGRTDSGVHALGQVCHFDAETPIPAERIADSVNPLLPADVKILESASVDASFDANRTAKRKTYLYRFYRARRDNPMYERYAVRVGEPLDLPRMEEACRLLTGEHDFKAFCASGSSVKTTVRVLYGVNFEHGGAQCAFRVTGNGFLYNMVRTLAGELLDIGRGRLSLADLAAALSTGDRTLVGKTMPARGLTLERVEYDRPIFSDKGV